MKRIPVLILFCSMLIAGCGKREKAEQPGKEKDAKTQLKVVTTVGMITDIVSTIGGEYTDVTGLMGPGVDPHLYKASHGDVELLSTADIVFYNGLHLEGKMTDVLVKMARARPVIAVSSAIPDSLLREPPEFAGQYDPHVWMVPALWKYPLGLIAEELGRLRPEGIYAFRERADSLRQIFEGIDEWARDEIASIPQASRVLITAHDAFGYFGQHYNIEVRGLQGISTATDYGLSDVTSLVDLIVERGVKGVFVESSVPTKPLEAVIEGCTSRGHEVKIGGTLFSDAMGEADTPEGTYVGMIRHNVTTIVKALK